jgi:hypothetical protein
MRFAPFGVCTHVCQRPSEGLHQRFKVGSGRAIVWALLGWFTGYFESDQRMFFEMR